MPVTAESAKSPSMLQMEKWRCMSFLSQLLSYGTYCIVGVLAVMGKVPLEVGIQGIALSGNFYGALKSSFLLWPKLAVAKVAEERLTQLFASENREEEIEGNEITLENVSFFL